MEEPERGRPPGPGLIGSQLNQTYHCNFPFQTTFAFRHLLALTCIGDYKNCQLLDGSFSRYMIYLVSHHCRFDNSRGYEGQGFLPSSVLFYLWIHTSIALRFGCCYLWPFALTYCQSFLCFPSSFLFGK